MALCGSSWSFGQLARDTPGRVVDRPRAARVTMAFGSATVASFTGRVLEALPGAGIDAERAGRRTAARGCRNQRGVDEAAADDVLHRERPRHGAPDCSMSCWRPRRGCTRSGADARSTARWWIEVPGSWP